MPFRNSEAPRKTEGTYDISELEAAGFAVLIHLIKGELDSFYTENDAQPEDCTKVSSLEELRHLFTEGVFLGREKKRLQEEADEVYAHELEHKKEAKQFGVSATIYFRRREVGKHDVFVYIPSSELRIKFKDNHLSLMRFYWKVMRAPSIRGIGNYPLEEKLANTLLQKVNELDRSSFEPLEEN